MVLLAELDRYIANPDEVEKEYMENIVNKCSNQMVGASRKVGYD
ncbi:MAG: hypothetical protein ABH886_02260 [Candidatus Desantisbacteria bacterium]